MAKRRLSRQQIKRIKQMQARRRARAERRGEDFDENSLGPEQEGLVIANYGPMVVIEDNALRLHRCRVRQNLDTMVCGDEIIWQSSGVDEGVIIALQQRQSLLHRPDLSGVLKPVAANLDQVVIVLAPQPAIAESLIDRYLAAVEDIGVQALLVLNKIDLLSESEHQTLSQRLQVYSTIGYRIVQASTRSAFGLHEIQASLRQRSSILVGQSGVGKSSLIKALLPDRDIRVQALSAATGLGTHTTSSSTLYRLREGGKLIDSPGVRSFELALSSTQALEHGFIEFTPYLGHCKFSNCRHSVEPQCAILAAVEQGKIDTRRWQSFQQMRGVLENKKN